MTYLALARKWRPQRFSDFQGQGAIIRLLTHSLRDQKVHHAYLFSGTRGVGKTTLGRLLAKALNCEQGIVAEPCGTCSSCVAIAEGRFIDLIEVDAASRTGVEETRALLENVAYLPAEGRFKIYLIDEVHMLSHHSFNALLKTLEEPPNHVKFLLATTDPDRMPVTVLSRCIRLPLQPLTLTQIVSQLEKVALAEKVSFQREALGLIAEEAKGSMREALGLLEQAILYGENDLQTPVVQALLGLQYQRDLPALLRAIVSREVMEGLAVVARMAEAGADFYKVLSSLMGSLHQWAITSLLTKEQAAHYFAQRGKEPPSVSLTPEEIQLLYHLVCVAQKEFQWVPDKRVGFEMLMLRMIAFQPEWPELSKKQVSVVPASESVSARKENTPFVWSEVVTQLPLSGLTRLLAKHCVVQKWDGKQLHLVLDEAQKACFNPTRQAHIQAAIRKVLGEEIQVTLTLGAVLEETPIQKETKEKHSQCEDASSRRMQGGVAERLMTTFDATVEEIALKT